VNVTGHAHDRQDPVQLTRLARFRALHPWVIVLLKGKSPVAWEGWDKITAATLRKLLDKLDAPLGER
jgi:hypothetical protein